MSAVDTLVNQGWLIEKYSAEGMEYLKKLSASFLDAVKKISPNCERLQDVHLYLSEDNFEDLHYNLTVSLHKTQPFYSIFKAELITLKKLFGLDLDIQSYPSLRISRPNIKDDNLQMHRDIEYGASIYEHSLWTPLHDVKLGGGMKLLPESIYGGYDGYELIDQTSKFEKGSKKNKSGLLPVLGENFPRKLSKFLYWGERSKFYKQGARRINAGSATSSRKRTITN